MEPFKGSPKYQKWDFWQLFYIARMIKLSKHVYLKDYSPTVGTAIGTNEIRGRGWGEAISSKNNSCMLVFLVYSNVLVLNKVVNGGC